MKALVMEVFSDIWYKYSFGLGLYCGTLMFCVGFILGKVI
nr:MAG TPA: hypothetical protein [Caudoviricetes sp.]